jgi:hypothetical protein
MLTRKIFESRLSEMPFPALWGDILQNSDGQKTTLLLYIGYSLSLGAPIEVGGPRVLPVRAHSSYATGSTAVYLNL